MIMKQKCNNFECPLQKDCTNQWSKRTHKIVCPEGMHWMSQTQWIRKCQAEQKNPMPFNQYMEYGF